MSAETSTSKFKNILAIGGFILLLVVGLWSAIQVIKFVPRIFSDTGVVEEQVTANNIELDGRDIAVRLSETPVQSGVPVRVEWAHTGDEKGILSFSYACTDGFYFQVDGRSVTCNEPYNVDVLSTRLDLVPLSVKTLVEVPLAITYTNARGENVRAKTTLVVDNSTIIEEEVVTKDEASSETEVEGPSPIEPDQTNTATPEQNQPTTSVQVPLASNPYGIADFQVQMVGVGEINSFGSFEPKTVLRPYSRGAAKFKVSNLGNKQTGIWYFTAFLPSRGGYPFTSQPQASLLPGASVEILITFDQLVPGTRTFSVQIDPLNYIPEQSEMNNSTGQSVTVLQY